MAADLDVLIPSYHPAEIVRQCLDSVAAQTLPLRSVTLVDDASPYDLSGLASEFPGIRFVRNATNRGIGGNLNRCLELARGEYVAFLHSDDMLEPRWHEVWQRHLEQAPREADLFMSASTFVDVENRPLYRLRCGRDAWCEGFPENLRRLWRHYCYGVTFSASLIYRRSFFERFGSFPFSDYPNNSDVYLNLRGLMESRLYYVPDLLFRFRRHAGQSVCQSDVQAARVAEAIFGRVAREYAARLHEHRFDFLREPMTVYHGIALAWLLRGDRERWHAYSDIGRSGNPHGWLSPWTWWFMARLAAQYVGRRAGRG
jgi:glycosyltransferase involved in cell wall biosynthesis